MFLVGIIEKFVLIICIVVFGNWIFEEIYEEEVCEIVDEVIDNVWWRLLVYVSGVKELDIFDVKDDEFIIDFEIGYEIFNIKWMIFENFIVVGGLEKVEEFI